MLQTNLILNYQSYINTSKRSQSASFKGTLNQENSQNDNQKLEVSLKALALKGIAGIRTANAWQIAEIESLANQIFSIEDNSTVINRQLSDYPKTRELLNEIDGWEFLLFDEQTAEAFKKNLLKVSVEIADKIEENPELFEKLVEIVKTSLSVQTYFDVSDMANELKNVMTNETAHKHSDLIIKLLNVKNPFGRMLFGNFSWLTEYYIERLVEQANKYPEFFEIALRIANDNSYFYEMNQYANTVGDKIQDIKEICDLTEENGKPRVYLSEIMELVEEVDDIQAQMETIKKLAELKDKNGKFRFNRGKFTDTVIANARYGNLDEILEFDDKFKISEYKIKKLAKALANCRNRNLKEFLLSPDYKTELAKNSAGKYQQEILEMLNSDCIEILDSGLTKDEFLSSVRKMSKSLFKWAYDRPNQYLSNIDTEWTTPVNGKLPKLPNDVLLEQRYSMKIFFSRNIGNIFRTLKYLDIDTVSHMMDKRTDIFEEQLEDLNQLSDENFELLSRLTQLKSAESGESLSAKEKIQLTQIVEIFQNANIDTNILKEYISQGEIDINEPKRIIQNEILKHAGIDIDNQNIRTDKKKFNEEFSYLALTNSVENRLNCPQMQETLENLRIEIERMKKNPKFTERKIAQLESLLQNPQLTCVLSSKHRAVKQDYLTMLKEADKHTIEELFEAAKRTIEVSLTQNLKNEDLFAVIRASVLYDFKDFITDTSNQYGQANAQTRAAFEKNGFNYEKWLNPDIKDIKLKAAGKQMKIRLWDRNPQEDLFIGNKTTCCTAIGSGGNGTATPIYLLNTAFNVVELYDSEGNVVGMSRVFMGKDKDKPVLLMDNIELNKTYIKGMTLEQLSKIRNGFFAYMNKYVEQVTGNKKSQVYFYANDVHVPVSDLVRKGKVIDFVGKIAQESVYVNSAYYSWIDPAKLKEHGKIDWLIVPKNAHIV